jgi:hypothetical protein
MVDGLLGRVTVEMTRCWWRLIEVVPGKNGQIYATANERRRSIDGQFEPPGL